MRLQDPDVTKVLLITLADTTPVLEAAGLQNDLERAGIHLWASSQHWNAFCGQDADLIPPSVLHRAVDVEKIQ